MDVIEVDGVRAELLSSGWASVDAKLTRRLNEVAPPEWDGYDTQPALRTLETACDALDGTIVEVTTHDESDPDMTY